MHLVDLIETMGENESDPLRNEILEVAKESIETMTQALQLCYALFDYYATEHRAKYEANPSEDRLEKAVTNENIASFVSKTFTTIEFQRLENADDFEKFKSQLGLMVSHL